jgi:TPR repeat protein
VRNWWLRGDGSQGPVLRAHLRCYTRRGIPAVSQIADLKQLGVAPARKITGRTPYLPRDADGQLADLLDSHRFVLLTGPAQAGKTRTAAEAIRRKFPDRRLIFPYDASALTALLAAGLDLGDSVIWLDEIEGYLPLGALARLMDRLQAADAPTGVTVVGTLRERLDPAESDRVASPVAGAFRAARRLRLDRRLTPAERARAAGAFTDPGLLAALDQHGLAEHLAAGPELVDRFEQGLAAGEAGALAAQAAADWQRTGMIRPLPAAVLADLLTRYAQRRTGQLASSTQPDGVLPPSVAGSPGVAFSGTGTSAGREARPDAGALAGQSASGPVALSMAQVLQAVAWAVKPVAGAGALAASTADGLAASDYLLDHLDGRGAVIADEAWHAALAAADPEEAVRIGLAAQHADRPELGVLAFGIAVRQESPYVDGVLAAYHHALLLERVGQPGQALESYRRAAQAGHVEAAYAAGRLLPGGQGEPYLLRAATAGHLGASFDLGRLLHDSRPEEALRWLGQAAGAGHAEAAYLAGGLALAASHETDAAGFYLLAAEQGHPEASYALGLLLSDVLPADALRWLGQAAESGHAEAAALAERMRARPAGFDVALNRTWRAA